MAHDTQPMDSDVDQSQYMAHLSIVTRLIRSVSQHFHTASLQEPSSDKCPLNWILVHGMRKVDYALADVDECTIYGLSLWLV